MKVAIQILLVLLLAAIAAAIGFRTRKNVQKKKNRPNTYAIQNTRTRTNIRPLDAGLPDHTPILLYPPRNWECQTWEFIRIEGNKYLLKNLFTEKTFEPFGPPHPGATLTQMSLGDGPHQYWVFEPQAAGSFLIHLADTDLYLTSSSEQAHTGIRLEPRQPTDAQEWRLIRQNPLI